MLKNSGAIPEFLTGAESEQHLQWLQQKNSEQQLWLSGYLFGLAQTGGSQQSAPEAVATSSPVEVVYASQTGNAKGVATQVAEQLKANGVAVNLHNISDINPKKLSKFSQLVFVASTHGEGDPPDDAIAWHQFINSKRIGKLDGLSFAVIALGDSSYEFFCQTGKDFNQAFVKAGAKELVPMLSLDVDYQADVDAWLSSNASLFKGASASTSVTSAPVSAAKSANQAVQAEVIANQKITGRDSTKVVHHIEFEFEEGALTYQPGDIAVVSFSNRAELVDALLAELQLPADEALVSALTSQKELTQISKATLQKWQQHSGSEALQALLDDATELRSFIQNNQFIDVVKTYPASIGAEALLTLLPQNQPRKYSIASAQSEVDSEVHLTVALAGEEGKFGGASWFLVNCEVGESVSIRIEANDHFKLPSDQTNVIMIGPGTGIAPFRSFMQERVNQGGSGENWLFFGDRTFTQDFLYQTEWQALVKSGDLSRISLAFSRDTEQKHYVQDEIVKHGADLVQWLDEGAHLYICGDAKRMAKDVEAALATILTTHKQFSSEEAQNYLAQLRSEKRYQKDVY